MADAAASALRDLRRKRQLNRLGSLDWFDAAYRVYLFGGFGGGGVLWLSSSLGDADVSSSAADAVLRHGPSVLGLVAALVLLAGLRGGAQGGPLALEAADVVHVMLAPVDRRAALRRPAVQRLRSAVFAGSLAGAVVGQLAGRRLPGSLLAWASGGALYGATVALGWMGLGLLAHTLRVPRWVATSVGLAVLGWQGVAVAWPRVPGPLDSVGGLGLWGWEQHALDLVPVVLAVLSVVVGFVLLRRISLDALARRSSLVAQLRFAVTMQDLRTVVLLRRQLNQEHSRRRPYLRLRQSPGARSFTRHVWRRGWHGLLRFPVTRLVRMAALAAGMGVMQAATVQGTTPAFIGTAVLGFVLGLEAMEPLSQEIDQPDRADALPVPRGELLYRHLFAPAVLLVPFAAVAGVAAFLALGADPEALVPVAVLALPTVWAGCLGGVISIVRDAPDPAGASSQQAFMPPEMVGFSSAIRLLWPIIVASLATCTALLPRLALQRGDSVVGASVRGAVGCLLLTGVVAYWVRVRDKVRASVRKFMEEGRQQTAAQRRSA